MQLDGRRLVEASGGAAGDRFGRLGSLMTLLQRRAPVDLGMLDGATPLMVAAQRGHLGVMAALLAAGADPAAAAHAALHLAAANGRVRTAAPAPRQLPSGAPADSPPLACDIDSSACAAAPRPARQVDTAFQHVMSMQGLCCSRCIILPSLPQLQDP